MFRKIFIGLLLIVCGCSATNQTSVQREAPLKALPPPVASATVDEAPKWKEVNVENFSFSIPASYKSVDGQEVKNVYHSTDSSIVVIAIVEQNTVSLKEYASTFVSAMEDGGIKLIGTRGGEINGHDFAVLAFLMNQRSVSFHLVTVDKTKAYNLNCTVSVLTAREDARKCFDIFKTIKIDGK